MDGRPSGSSCTLHTELRIFSECTLCFLPGVSPSKSYTLDTYFMLRNYRWRDQKVNSRDLLIFMVHTVHFSHSTRPPLSASISLSLVLKPSLAFGWMSFREAALRWPPGLNEAPSHVNCLLIPVCSVMLALDFGCRRHYSSSPTSHYCIFHFRIPALNPSSTASSSFLLMCIMGSSRNSSNGCVPAAHVGHQAVNWQVRVLSWTLCLSKFI